VLFGGPGLSAFSGDSGSVVRLELIWAAWCGSDRFLVWYSVRFLV
jgi:hypothetical protein